MSSTFNPLRPIEEKGGGQWVSMPIQMDLIHDKNATNNRFRLAKK